MFFIELKFKNFSSLESTQKLFNKILKYFIQNTINTLFIFLIILIFDRRHNTLDRFFQDQFE